MKDTVRLFFISDIVGRSGRRVIQNELSDFISSKMIDYVIANGENSAGGLGITSPVFNELRQAGIDVFTTGNHVWKRKEVMEIIDNNNLLRPANYPDEAPGKGYGIYKIPVVNIDLGIINLQGRIFMEPINCPFQTVDTILKEMQETCIVIVDFHAEATSEKLALAWYLDGKVSAVIGTHTHVQTSDSRIFPNGTAYISDAGMTGSRNGVIGVSKEEIIRHFINRLPFTYKACQGNDWLEGVIIEILTSNGKAVLIEPVSIQSNE